MIPLWNVLSYWCFTVMHSVGLGLSCMNIVFPSCKDRSSVVVVGPVIWITMAMSVSDAVLEDIESTIVARLAMYE